MDKHVFVLNLVSIDLLMAFFVFNSMAVLLASIFAFRCS